MTASQFNARIKNKRLAFAYCVELDRAANAPDQSAPFLVRPLWKWQWLSKAKVVSLRSHNPLSWPAGLWLKTGSSLEYDVYLTFDCLIMTTNGYPKMTTVGISDPIDGPGNFDLSGSHWFTKYGYGDKRQYGWVAIPGYPTLTSPGYLSIQMTANESDPSNIKKTLTKGAEYLDANRQSIIDRVVGSH
jgi:hypothetical protein